VEGPPTVQIANSLGQGFAGVDVTVMLNQYSFSSTVGTQTATTDAAGFAIFDQLTIDEVASGYQLIFDADYTGVLNVTSGTFDVVNSAPDHLTLITQPDDTEAGASILGPPTVRVEDEFGNNISGITVEISLTGGGVFDAGTLTAVSNSDGLAVFNDLVLNSTGAYSLTFSSIGVPDLISAPFNIISGTISYRYKGNTHSGFANTGTTDKLLGQTPTRLEITAQPQESIAGSTVSGSPTVVLYDEVDNPIADINITVSVDGFFNGSSTTQVTTNDNGEAIFNNLIIDDLGTYKLSFSATGYLDVSTVISQPFNVVNQMLSVSATTNPAQTIAGEPVQGFPTIKLQNEFGQGFEGVDVTATINQHEFAATSTTTVTTNASGLAIFDNLILETAADNYEIIYDIDYTGVSNETSAPFSIIPAPASSLTIITQPSDGLAESAIEGPPTVALYDDYNNAIDGVDIFVTEVGGYPIDNGTTTIATNADGIASFTNLVINTAGEYTLNFNADAAGVPDVQSTTFQILPGNIADRFTGGSHSGFSTQEEPDVLLKQTPVSIAFITQPQQSVTNLPVQGPPFLQVLDSNGRPVQSTAVTASIVGGTPALAGTITLETNSNGEVLFNDISIPQTGTYQLRFQVIGYPTVFVVSQEFEVTTQTLAINITQQPQNSVAGEIIGGFPSVQITNSLSQPGPEGVEVTVIVNQNTLSSDPAHHTALTDASGEAVFDQLIINTAAENYQLIFEVDYPGINSISTGNFTISPAAPDHLSVDIQPGDSETGAAIAGPPTAALYDVYNNPISGVDVTVTEIGGEPLGGTASLATDENGMAAFSNLTIASAGLYQLVFDADAIGVANELSTTFNIISAETAHRFKGGTHSGFIQSEIVDQLLSEPPSVEDPIFTEGEANLCQGSTNIQYTATAANSESIAYSLSIGGAGTIDETTGLLDLAAGFTGAFNVIATAEGYNGPTSETFAVTVDANIDAPAFTDPVIVVCEGATETYTASSVNTTVIAYSVSPPEAGAIDASTGAMAWNAGFNGASFISATAGEVGDCGGQQTTTIEVTVNPEIDAPTFTQGAVELCQDAPNEIYTAIAANADDILYSASPVEAFVTINTNTGEIDWAADFSGTATITARATGLCGGPKDTDREVIIRPTPSTGVISGAQDVACNGSGITYSVPLTAGSSYAWTVPAEATITNGENGPDNNEITVNFGETSGFIRVVETSQFGCDGNQQELQITLHGCSLAANFTADQTESCEGSTVRFTNLSTGDIDSWEWDFGVGATPQTATGIGPHDVVYDNAGQYTVSLTVHEQMVQDTRTETNYITINSIGTWLGTVSSNWFDSDNWSCGTIPNLSETAFDVTISATAAHNPQISGAGARVKNITIENGAALTIAAGTNLTVTGNWINNGNFGGSGGTVIFRGDNCTVSGTATTNFENIQVYENKQLIGHSGNMNINGDFIINGLLTHNGGTISFTGTNAQQISGSAAQVVFNDIIINKSAENLTLGKSIEIAGNLTLTDGIVFTDAANLLTIQHGGGATEGNANSFIDGLIAKIGNTAFTFPTGDGPVWAPIAITAPTNTSDAFRAEYFFEANEHTTRPCTNCESGIEYISAVEHWDLSRTAGTATPDVTMYFKNMVRSGISDLSDLVYAHWNGAQWVNMGETAFDDGANACYITGTGFTSYSPHAPASKLGSNPLPIELLSFSAKPYNNQIKLEWTTLAELNNDYFTIEKTLDGITFDFVTQMEGAGNSATPLTYSTLDANPYTGTSYYRLTQTDFDGTKVSFPLEEVYFENEMAKPALTIFPNPASADNAVIEISNVANQQLTITIFNETGGQLHTSELKTNKTSNKIIITQNDIETQLKPGMYLIRVSGRNISLQKKMIIL
ncbi:MAG: PKD domain-containing protein, partial [Salinivirgaceae bacterium]